MPKEEVAIVLGVDLDVTVEGVSHGRRQSPPAGPGLPCMHLQERLRRAGQAPDEVVGLCLVCCCGAG